METLNFYLTLLTFIPWIPLYIITIIRSLNDSKKVLSWNYFKNHLIDIFRIDILILIIFFFFFASFKQSFVNKYLFPVMCMYLFANSFYEKREKIQKDFIKNNIIELIILFIVMVVPIIFYVIYRKLSLTYKIMFMMLFLEYFIVGFARKVRGIFKFKNNHK